MTALNIKKGASGHSAYDLRANFDERVERRTLAVLVMAPEKTAWAWNETWAQRIMLGIGAIGLFILGVFPQVARPLLVNLPLMFTHLGQ